MPKLCLKMFGGYVADDFDECEVCGMDCPRKKGKKK